MFGSGRGLREGWGLIFCALKLLRRGRGDVRCETGVGGVGRMRRVKGGRGGVGYIMAAEVVLGLLFCICILHGLSLLLIPIFFIQFEHLPVVQALRTRRCYGRAEVLAQPWVFGNTILEPNFVPLLRQSRAPKDILL